MGNALNGSSFVLGTATNCTTAPRACNGSTRAREHDCWILFSRKGKDGSV